MPLILPRPDNVRGRFGSYVTGDMFHIAERLQEIEGGESRLFIQAFDEPLKWRNGIVYNFAITEVVPERGTEELVMRVKDLDARVIQEVERMRRIPFAQRFALAEAREAAWQESEKQRQLDELYEQMGEPMLRKLEECNFIDPKWLRSRPRLNKTAQRHRNAKVILPAGVSA